MILLDRWGAMLRLLFFNDQRGTVSQHAEQASAEARALGVRFEAEVENTVRDIRNDPLRDLLRTFPR